MIKDWRRAFKHCTPRGFKEVVEIVEKINAEAEETVASIKRNGIVLDTLKVKGPSTRLRKVHRSAQ